MEDKHIIVIADVIYEMKDMQIQKKYREQWKNLWGGCWRDTGTASTIYGIAMLVAALGIPAAMIKI